MEAAFKIVCNLRDVRYVKILSVLVVVFCELEVYLLSEEIFQEELH
jgi:hypothetical protein